MYNITFTVLADYPTGLLSTSDSNAIASDLMSGKTAYVQGEKVTGSYTPENLDNVITAQENKLEALETLLEGKVGGGKVKANIFVQENEPTKKDGIWLQTNKTAEHYISDDNIFTGGTWALASETANIPFSFMEGYAVSIDDDVYIFGGSTNKTTAYRYNVLTNIYTQLADIPYQFYQGGATAVGTDIYLFGGAGGSKKAYKYDTLTDTWTQLTDLPISFYDHVVASVGTNIYIMGGYISSGTWYYTNNYKYNTLTDTYTKMTNIPYDFYGGSATVVGTDIYIFGSSGSGNYRKNYKYNTLTDTWTQMTSIPYAFNKGGAVAIGTNIYLLGGTSINNKRNNYKYNTLTDTWTQMTSIPYDFYNGSATVVGTDIYLLGGEGSKTTNRKFYAENKSYETDNTVVIAQGRTYSVGYNTKLFETNFETDFQPLYGFADAWFYTLQDGLDGTMPVYYGDGTQWINIKNPPTEGGNE